MNTAQRLTHGLARVGRRVGKPLFRRRFTNVGAAPGEFHSAPGGIAPRIHAIRYSADAIEEFDPTDARQAHDLVRDGSVAWLDVQGLGDQDLIRAFGEEFGLHPLAVADTVNVGQRPKVEDYDDRVYCVLRMVTLNEHDEIHWEQVSLFIGPGFVLSFQETYGDCLGPVRERLRQGKKQLRAAGGDFLGAMLLDAIVDGYFPVLEEFGDRLEDIETRVIGRPGESVLGDVYRAKRELMMFRRATWPLRDALNQLLRESHELIDEGTLPYIRDAADHVMQVVDVNETYREIATSFVDVYLSAMANRTNEVMRVLTIMATVFIPLTFLAGIYGMNFTDMPELHWRYGYLAFWIASVTVVILMLGMFRHFGWIGPQRRRERRERRRRRKDAE